MVDEPLEASPTRYRPEEFKRIFGISISELQAQGVDIDAYVKARLTEIRRKSKRQDAAERLLLSEPVFWRYRLRYVTWMIRVLPPLLLAAIFAVWSSRYHGALHDVLAGIAIAALAGCGVCFAVGAGYFALHLGSYFGARPSDISRTKWFFQTRNQLRDRFSKSD